MKPPTEPTVAVLIANYVALMLLLALTAGLSFVPLGPWQGPAALLVAATKMALVFLFFMQLRYQSGMVRVFAAAGFFWLAISGILTFSDYLTRGWRL